MNKNENELNIASESGFNGVFIPDYILSDKRLSISEKLYLSVYKQYGESECISGEIMSYVVSQSEISKVKSKLRNLGLVKKVLSPSEAKEEVLRRKGKGMKCEWCGSVTFSLQNHHFPIPKKLGGTDTVRICPNCHYEYHAILNGS